MLITVDHIHLIIVIKVYPNNLVLIKPSLCLGHVVTVVVVLTLLETDILLFQF